VPRCTPIGLSHVAKAVTITEVLLTRYAKCLDGRQDVANRRLEELLRENE
jgi:hypothetical protein